ncbi:MAG: FAD-dependent oxidoreductase [Clostridiales bacterium]|nr:FAD-dependent oxidoreductase [Clostridiales bacterium]
MGTTKTVALQSRGNPVVLDVQSVAAINSGRCVNCGECRDICPVGAISEQQRVICRLCPTCTDKPAMLYDDMEALATKESCTSACPLGISPQGYINLVAAGREREAFQHIWDRNPLISICGRICHHPCEQACKRGTLVDEPMSIRGVKRYLGDAFEGYECESYPVIYEEEIAVIGAGPAGLMAAHKLALYGYRVTVFEKDPAAGGMLNNGVPKFRIPRDVITRDIGRLEKAGITFRFGVNISPNQIGQLKKDFDIIIIAAGTPYSKELKIEGWRNEGVYTALNFMDRVNADETIRSHCGQQFAEKGDVVVIGGGNVALDCARTALRLGAKSVTAVCLESGADVPCHDWEREEAEEEGVVLLEGWAPKEFKGVLNLLQGVELEKVAEFTRSEDGVIAFTTNPSETRSLPADCVIVAIGQAAAGMWKGCESDDAFLFAGDISGADCSVVDAMASGRLAAQKADEALRGFRRKEGPQGLSCAPVEEKVYLANRLKVARPAMPIVPADERAANFDEVELDYSKDIIDVEVKRCLKCGYQKIDASLCIGCGVCATVCPKGDVISMVSYEEGGEENV